MKALDATAGAVTAATSADGSTPSVARALRPDASPSRLIDASRQLEGVFLNMVFEEMAKTVPNDGLFARSPGLEMVQGWLRAEISERWAESGGVGLGDRIAAQVGGDAVGFVLDSRSAAPNFEVPVQGRVTSRFGLRRHPVTGQPDQHEGVDIAVPVGTEVRTPFPGRVVAVQEHPELGRTVVIEHPAGYRTVYGHIREAEVSVGDHVDAADVVARSGDSGTSTGPHLHFAMYWNGRAVNPEQWIPGLRAVRSTTQIKSAEGRQVFDAAPDRVVEGQE